MLELFVVAVISLSFWLEASIGFGGGLVSIPLLALSLTVAQAITLVLLFQFMKGSLVLFNWKSIDWKAFQMIGFGVVLGCIFGTLAQAYLPQKIAFFLLGALVLFYVVRGRLFPDMGNALIQKIPKFAAGLIGGLVQGGFGIGGPIFVMYYNETMADKVKFRATLIGTFLICNTIRLFVSVPSGLITQEVLVLAGYAFVPFVIALYLGQKFHTKISDDAFKLAIDVLLLISSVSLLIKALV